MNKSSLFIFVGSVLIGFAVFILFFTFWPAAGEEINYQAKAIFSQNKNYQLTIGASDPQEQAGKKQRSLDPDFGIFIPRIDALAKVIPSVDPQNPEKYQKALTQGVAHALGSSLPDEKGNIFIFSHSSLDFYLANRYNSVFYLLGKLEIGDLIYLSYKNKLYTYQVTAKKVVEAQETEYLKSGSGRVLTLMTCWPPGTSLKRLIVRAQLAE